MCVDVSLSLCCSIGVKQRPFYFRNASGNVFVHECKLIEYVNIEWMNRWINAWISLHIFSKMLVAVRRTELPWDLPFRHKLNTSVSSSMCNRIKGGHARWSKGQKSGWSHDFHYWLRKLGRHWPRELHCLDTIGQRVCHGERRVSWGCRGDWRENWRADRGGVGRIVRKVWPWCVGDLESNLRWKRILFVYAIGLRHPIGIAWIWQAHHWVRWRPMNVVRVRMPVKPVLPVP